MIVAAEKVEHPFPGLRPFERNESRLFFGRDGQVDALLERFSRSRFLAVVGVSGSGKSSLVRAGLLPVLYGDFLFEVPSRWRVAVFRPAGDPIGNMARALSSPEVFAWDGDRETLRLTTEATLRRSGLGLVQTASEGLTGGGKLLIVVDQFEEIFRMEKSGDALRAREGGAAFVKLLLEATRQQDVPVYVALTMRSDFLGECAQFRDLPEALNENQYLIPRMTRDQLRQAVTGPVAVAGAEITPRLVQRLLNDIGEDQDQLPVLQHALMRTWDHWRKNQAKRPLDLEDYEAVGGMAEALSRHAEEAFRELPDVRSRKIAEKIFQAITEKPPDQPETRRPTKLSEICAISDEIMLSCISVIDCFRAEGRAFLIPPYAEELHANSVIDISHESLIRQWGRLRELVQEEAESRTRYLRIADAARDFKTGEAGLWRDPQLQLALDWRDRKQPNAEWAKRFTPAADSFEAAMAFLEQCTRAREEERRRVEAQQSAKQRLLYGTVGAGVLLTVIFAGLAFWAWRNQRLAESERKRADDAKVRAEASAAEASRLQKVAEQERGRSEDAARQTEALRKIAEHQKSLAEDEAKRAGVLREIAEKEQARARDEAARAEQETARARDEAAKAEQAADAADTAAREAGRQRLIAEELRKLALARQLVAQSDLTRNGAPDQIERSVLLAIESLRRVPLLENGRALRQGLPLLLKPIWSDLDGADAVAFSPDGRYLATGSLRGARVLEAASGREVSRLAYQAPVRAVVFSPDGHHVATVSGDRTGASGERTARVFETASGKEVSRLAHQGIVRAVAFSPDGRYVATGSDDRTARVFEAASGNEVSRLAHQRSVRAVAFSPDGRYVATGSDDGTARVFDGASGKEASRLAHQGPVLIVAFSPDGRYLATGSDDKTARVFELASGKEVSRLAHQGPVRAVAFSPDGHYVATGSDDRTSRVFQAASGREVSRLENPGDIGDLDTVGFSPDGRYVATGMYYAEAASGEGVRLVGGGDLVAFSPDGRYMATGGWETVTRVFELASGRVSWLAAAEPCVIGSVALSPDGRYVATGCWKGPARVFEATSGKEVLRLAHQEPVSAIALSPGGRYVATASGDSTARVFEVASSKEVSRLAHQGIVRAVAFSPDGRYVATGSDDKTARVFEVASSKELSRLAHQGTVGTVAFSPDGRYVATRSDDRTARVFVAASGKEVSRLGNPEARDTVEFNHTAAFSPDGRYVATAGNDGTARVFEAASGKEAWRLGVQYIRNVAFTGDAKYVLSVVGPGPVIVERHLWRSTDLINEACSRLTRNLTPEEWKQYLGDEPYRKTCSNLP